MDRRWRLGSEELETLLHVLGDAAALPGRLAPDVRVDDDTALAVRRTAAHSLRARGVLSPDGVEPDLAAALAVATRQVLAYEIDLERGGVVISGAAAADAADAVVVLPSADGTVLLLATSARDLAAAVVEAVRTGGNQSDDRSPDRSGLGDELLVEPAVLDGLPPDDPDALTAMLAARGADPRLAPLLAGRTGSAVVRAVVPPGPDGPDRPDSSDDADGGWRESGVPLSWWETDAGRVLVGAAPGPLVRVRPGGDDALLEALAELAASVAGSLLTNTGAGSWGGTP